MRQLVDFGGLCVENNIFPTDIDGLIEYKDSEYIIFEVKRCNARVPYGQRLALQRMVDDFTKIGKRAVAIVCEHNVKNSSRAVILANCWVREAYDGKNGEWKTPMKHTSVRDAVDIYISGSNGI